MGIKEILDAKRLAAQAAASPAPVAEVAKEVIATTVASMPKQEVPVTETKKLSFAEMMAAKRLAASSNSTNSAAATMTSASVTGVSNVEAGDSNLSQAPAQTAQVQTEGAAVIPATGVIGMLSLDVAPHTERDTSSERGEDVSNERRDEALKNATPEDEQAYVMIRSKIDALWGTEDEHLEGAMSDLKKSLMQNPNACLLMYDADLGEMVKNLRRLTKEAQAEAAKEKTSTKKVKAQKMLALTPEMMEQAFSEL